MRHGRGRTDWRWGSHGTSPDEDGFDADKPTFASLCAGSAGDEPEAGRDVVLQAMVLTAALRAIEWLDGGVRCASRGTTYYL